MKKIFILLACCICIPYIGWACTGKTSIISGMSMSSVIFSGTVKNIECIPDVKLSPEEAELWHRVGSEEKFDIYTTVFSVKEIFIGQENKEITIKQTGIPIKNKHCEPHTQSVFELGKEYLVYAYGNQDKTLSVIPWTDGGCGITKYLKDVASEEMSLLWAPGSIFQEIANKKINQKVK